MIILAGLQGIPGELYEAASIDGASAWRKFRHITLPLVKPALLLALLFRTIDALKVFDLVFVMTQGGPADTTNLLQFYGYKKSFAEGMRIPWLLATVLVLGASPRLDAAPPSGSSKVGDAVYAKLEHAKIRRRSANGTQRDAFNSRLNEVAKTLTAPCLDCRLVWSAACR